MGVLLTNNASSKLAGPITNTAVTANLEAGTGALFPSPSGGDYFPLTFVDAATGAVNEIVHVTARSVDIITMVRGQEGTTAKPWLANDIAALLVTAATLLGFQFPDRHSGYQEFPSGEILQWGTGSCVCNTSAGPEGGVTWYFGGTTITFPIPFPTACDGVQITPIDTAGHLIFNALPTSSVSATTLPVNAHTTQNGGTVNFYWQAIGH